MARKVYVTVTVKLVLNVEDGVDINDVISEMDYSFSSEDAYTLDTEILNFDITDSK